LRELSASIDAWTANAVRYPLSALLYWPVLFVTWRSGSLNRRVVARCAVPASLALAGQVLFALAPYYLTASSIGFFLRSSLVWSLLGAMSLFPDERRLLRVPGFYMGLSLSAGGFVALAVSRGMLDVSVTMTGVAIISVCSLFFGLYGVSVRRCLRGIHPLVGFGVVSQFVSAGALIAVAAFGRPQDLLTLSVVGWCELVVSAILGIAFGHLFLYAAVGRLGAAIPAGVGALTPLVTAALAFLFLGESLTTVQWMAGIAMMIGAIVLLRTQQVVVGDRRR
jgi:drug/metabolite transporter (DMT)-like permease